MKAHVWRDSIKNDHIGMRGRWYTNMGPTVGVGVVQVSRPDRIDMTSEMSKTLRITANGFTVQTRVDLSTTWQFAA